VGEREEEGQARISLRAIPPLTISTSSMDSSRGTLPSSLDVEPPSLPSNIVTETTTPRVLRVGQLDSSELDDALSSMLSTRVAGSLDNFGVRAPSTPFLHVPSSPRCERFAHESSPSFAFAPVQPIAGLQVPLPTRAHPPHQPHHLPLRHVLYPHHPRLISPEAPVRPDQMERSLLSTYVPFLLSSSPLRGKTDLSRSFECRSTDSPPRSLPPYASSAPKVLLDSVEESRVEPVLAGSPEEELQKEDMESLGTPGRSNESRGASWVGLVPVRWKVSSCHFSTSFAHDFALPLSPSLCGRM
jgi:hypothetical protein